MCIAPALYLRGRLTLANSESQLKHLVCRSVEGWNFPSGSPMGRSAASSEERVKSGGRDARRNLCSSVAGCMGCVQVKVYYVPVLVKQAVLTR